MAFAGKPYSLLCFSFCAAFSFLMKECGVERCLWQMQRDEARAKQGESNRQRSFDYALALVKSGKRTHFFGLSFVRRPSGVWM